VLREATRLLAAAGWQGEEQAAILLGQLGHKPAAARLVELLPAERPEVFIAAAWSLRKLAVADTLPQIMEYASHRYEQLVTSSNTVAHRAELGSQLSQLMQFVGQARYQPADAFLRRLLPRVMSNGSQSPVSGETRAAVAWALGFLHEKKSDDDVALALEMRLLDYMGGAGAQGSDHLIVRRMAAISLGRMKARSALGSLDRFGPSREPSLDPLNNACIWAISQITGEPLAKPGVVEYPVEGWFINPIKSP